MKKRKLPAHIKYAAKKSNSRFNFIIGIMLAVILLLGVIYGYGVFRDVFGSSRVAAPVEITIPQGAAVNQIADILKQNGIIKQPFLFKLYSNRKGGGGYFFAGDYYLNKNMSYAAIIEILKKSPQNVLPGGAVRVTIPEGFEFKQIADRFADMVGHIDRDRFTVAANNGVFEFDFIKDIKRQENRLEGYLFPATYDILKDDDEYVIINKMLKAFSEAVVPVYEEIKPRINGKNQTLDEIVIMASVVEREAVGDNDRSLVSSVFYNRIARGMRLESCATVEYILHERKAVLSVADTQINSPYNTYRNTGLPAGPIASPGLAAIRAAMEPEKSDYLFFTLNKTGDDHVFTKTLAEHNAATRERETSQDSGVRN